MYGVDMLTTITGMFGISVEKLATILTNIILVSIPEEVFLTAFTLLLLKRLELPYDISKLLLPVVGVAVISNILRYKGVNINTVFLLSILILFLLILVTDKVNRRREVLRAFACLLLSISILQILELSYTPLIFYATNKTFSDFNNSIILNFIITIPERIVEFSLVIWLHKKRNDYPQINIFRKFLRSKSLMILTIIILIANTLYLFLACRLIGYDKILISLSISDQLAIIIGVLTFPILNLAALWALVHKISSEDLNENLFFKTRLVLLIDSIKRYTKNGEYENIYTLLEDVKREVDKKERERK
ncbi:MAG: hypothetical protein N3B21_05225 [Clostridia bacterium]|nr:hypothetical protein [Clostridia bacterium]